MHIDQHACNPWVSSPTMSDESNAALWLLPVVLQSNSDTSLKNVKPTCHSLSIISSHGSFWAPWIQEPLVVWPVVVVGALAPPWFQVSSSSIESVYVFLFQVQLSLSLCIASLWICFLFTFSILCSTTRSADSAYLECSIDYFDCLFGSFVLVMRLLLVPSFRCCF
jgi:hypothetical protein